MLIGSAHLLFADRTGTPPEAAALDRMVATVIAGVTRERRRPTTRTPAR